MNNFLAVKKKSGSDVNGYYHIDNLWSYLKDLEKPGTNLFEFDLLFKVAEISLTIPQIIYNCLYNNK